VVVPSNRAGQLAVFLEEWQGQFAGRKVIVVWDGPPDTTPVLPGFKRDRDLFDWDGIPDWIPRGSDMIRSYGLYKAWRSEADLILTLDDDVRPQPGVDLFEEYERVFQAGAPLSDYLDVGALTSSGLQMRGYPYADRVKAPVAVQYGGWDGVLDYDARTQLAGVNEHETFHPIVMPVPKGTPVTGCIMNCAFRREYALLLWQLPLLEGRYNRFGDIWAGLFAKKVVDRLGAAIVVNGRARVRHERASDPHRNLEREKPGVPVNENMWRALNGYVSDKTLKGAYKIVTDRAAQYINETDPEYADHFIDCRGRWLQLFSEHKHPRHSPLSGVHTMD
jgi:hypothetical protein